MIQALSSWLRARLRAAGVYLYDHFKARLDFRQARGHQHLQRLRDLDSELSGLITTRQEKLRRHKEELHETETRIRDRARNRAFQQLLKEELTDIRGVGSTLAERIRNHPYIHDPASLRRYIDDVHGVGEGKAVAVRRWVGRRSEDLDTRAAELIRDRNVVPHLQRECDELVDAIEEEEDETSRLEWLRAQARNAIDYMEAVEPGHLVELRRKEDPDRELIETVDGHFTGLFAPWEEAPAWYRAAEEEVDGAG